MMARLDPTTNAAKHLTIVTFHVNGLFDNGKRQKIFQML